MESSFLHGWNGKYTLSIEYIKTKCIPVIKNKIKKILDCVSFLRIYIMYIFKVVYVSTSSAVLYLFNKLKNPLIFLLLSPC